MCDKIIFFILGGTVGFSCTLTVLRFLKDRVVPVVDGTPLDV